jgi:hypothetical protein
MTATTAHSHSDAHVIRQDYGALTKLLKEISLLNSASSALTWDMEVVMPKGASAARGQQMAVVCFYLCRVHLRVSTDGVNLFSSIPFLLFPFFSVHLVGCCCP